MTQAPAFVYRSQAVAMFDEAVDGIGANTNTTTKKRTRISARFDRTHWSAEYDRHPYNPDRGDGGTPIGHVSADPRYVMPRRERERLRIAGTQPNPDAPRRYTEADLAAQPEHGAYRLVRIAPHGERGGWRITAVCAGGHCDGKVRIFDPQTWLDTTRGSLGCTSCEAKNRAVRLRAKLEAETNTRHGLYELVGHAYDRCAHRVIVGRCTGPMCKGSTRNFSFSTWQNGDEGRLGCKRCCRLTLVKSECPHGHVYDAANTVIDSEGKKRCNACALIRRDSRLVQMRAWWHRSKDERAMNRKLTRGTPMESGL